MAGRVARLLILAALATGCASGTPTSPAPPDRVTCEICRKEFPREETRADINLEGIDVHTCRPCLAKKAKAPRSRRR